MPKTIVAKPAAREDYDGPWKNFIEAHFPQLITFFVSAAADEIDWTKKPVSLNTELRRLRRGNEAGDQRVDALFQVFLKNGDSRYVLVHIEVQSTRDHNLPDRMYEYAYRVWDRHRQRVAGIVILADTGPRFEQPSEFGWELWGTKMAYNFPVIRLLDLAQDRQKLEESSNVFAVATLAQLDAKATRDDPEARLDAKRKLIRRLYEKRYSREEIVSLFQLIDWMLHLPDEQAIIFEADLESMEAEHQMPYITSIERRAEARGEARGIERGIAQGIERGIERGREQGLQEGRIEQLRRLLEHRFGPLPVWALDRLGKAPSTQVDTWTFRVLDSAKLEDVFC